MKTNLNLIFATVILCVLTSASAMELRPYGYDGTPRTAAQGQALEVQTQINRESPDIRKMGVDLAELYHEHQQYQQSADHGVKPFHSANPINHVTDGYVVIDAVSSSIDTTALVDELTAMGMKNVASAGRIVSGLLPITSISDLPGCNSLAFANPSVIITNAHDGMMVAGQGDPAMQTDIVRSNFALFGIDGTGQTVGVISDSYDRGVNLHTTAADDIASGDLPTADKITILDDRAVGSDEGRAMMQLIFEVAPGAKQSFHTARGGAASFATGILELAAAGATVIIDDVGFINMPFFQDGIIAQAVNAVHASGAPYFSAAGNSGRKSYQAVYVDPGNSLHDFDPGPGVDTIQQITLPPGTSQFVFQWAQPFFSVSGAPGATTNMDIILVGPGNNVICLGAAPNIGMDALEIIACTNSTGAPIQANMQIRKTAGPDPGLMKYIIFGGATINEFATNSSTNFGHMNTAGGMAIGAAFYQQTPVFNGAITATIEAFSSAGGTPILFDVQGNPVMIDHMKPDIVAVDGTNTTFFGSDRDGDGLPNFSGTSAAAPHAAAVAALMRQADPTLTPNQIYDRLRETAIDMDDPFTPGFDVGYDTGTGFGYINPLAAVKLLQVGTAAGEVLEGTLGADLIVGGGGHDELRGNLVANDGDPTSLDQGDMIFGGGGNDLILGNQGDDMLLGGTGLDTIFGGRGNDMIEGNEGNDTLDGNLGDDVIRGGEGDDTLYGSLGSDTMMGGAGADTMFGNNPSNSGDPASLDGGDILFGGIGNDIMYGNQGDDTMSGEAGNDYLSGGRGKDLVIGGDGDDTVLGNRGDDVLLGGAGVDQLAGGLGNDTIEGGDGADVIFGNDLANNGSATSVDGGDTISGGAGPDILMGNQGNDTINGNTGMDMVFGGKGDDTLAGGEDNDLIFGNLGADSIVWVVGHGRDLVDGGDGVDQLFIRGSAEAEQFFVENPTDYTNRTGLAPTAGAQVIVSRGIAVAGVPITVIMETINVEGAVSITGNGGADTLMKSASYPGGLDPNNVTLVPPMP